MRAYWQRLHQWFPRLLAFEAAWAIDNGYSGTYMTSYLAGADTRVAFNVEALKEKVRVGGFYACLHVTNVYLLLRCCVLRT